MKSCDLYCPNQSRSHTENWGLPCKVNYKVKISNMSSVWWVSPNVYQLSLIMGLNSVPVVAPICSNLPCSVCLKHIHRMTSCQILNWSFIFILRFQLDTTASFFFLVCPFVSRQRQHCQIPHIFFPAGKKESKARWPWCETAIFWILLFLIQCVLIHQK